MAEQFVVERAERSQVKLRLAFQAVSGGGKTGTCLLVAKGMVAELERRGKLPTHLDVHIGLIDTEQDSASLYSHLVPFDRLVLKPPYSPQRYSAALQHMAKIGYSVCIVDQMSHEWTGPGGCLDIHQQVLRTMKYPNDFTAWGDVTPLHDAFMEVLLNYPGHLLCTMRSKTQHVIEKQIVKGQEKNVVVRLGLKAKQREGVEFDFTTVMDLAQKTNEATCHKDRTGMFHVGDVVPRDSKPLPGSDSLGMGVGWGEKLIEWCYSATKPAAEVEGPTPEDRCVAMADAGIRACQRAPNPPDLITAFDGAQKALRAMAPSCGAEVAKREIARLVAAKDARKADFGALGGVAQAAPAGGPISADDCANLETLLADAGVVAADLKARFSVPRLGALSVGQWDAAVSWVIAKAAENGIVLRRIARVPDIEHRATTAVDKVHAITERIASERGDMFAAEHAARASGFEGMPDDLPWADEQPR